MNQVKYELSNKLLKNLSEIQLQYGKLEGSIIPQNLLLDLSVKNLIQSTYSSNSIEGNPLSHLEVTNLLLDERVAVNRDEKEVISYFELLQTLEEKVTRPFTLDTVLQIHNELFKAIKPEIAGEIRNTKVVVGLVDSKTNEIAIKHNPPEHTAQKIKARLEDLINWVNENDSLPILKAGVFHHEFVFIHPFEDGNGRVCRLTTALLFLQFNYKINKYFVLDDYYDLDRTLYSDKLHSADSGDKTEWLEYFTEGIKYSLQSALAKIDRGLSDTLVSRRPTRKESEVFKILQSSKEVTSRDVAERLQISRQQAFILLSNLVKKGYVVAKAKGKARYYAIK